MSLILQDRKFVVVPANQENLFMHNVITNYMDWTRFKPGQLATELSVSDEMLDTLNSITSLEIFEDQHAYKALEKQDEAMAHMFEQLAANQYEDFLHDVILAFENVKLSYQLEYDGTYHNLPYFGVW